MNQMNNFNDMKNEVKKTANKAKHVAKEVAGDVKDNFQGAIGMMENKAHDIKQKAQNILK